MSLAMPFTEMSYWPNEEFPKLSQLTQANFGTLSIMKDMTSLLGMYNRQMAAILGLGRVLH